MKKFTFALFTILGLMMTFAHASCVHCDSTNEQSVSIAVSPEQISFEDGELCVELEGNYYAVKSVKVESGQLVAEGLETAFEKFPPRITCPTCGKWFLSWEGRAKHMRETGHGR